MGIRCHLPTTPEVIYRPENNIIRLLSSSYIRIIYEFILFLTLFTHRDIPLTKLEVVKLGEKLSLNSQKIYTWCNTPQLICSVLLCWIAYADVVYFIRPYSCISCFLLYQYRTETDFNCNTVTVYHIHYIDHTERVWYSSKYVCIQFRIINSIFINFFITYHLVNSILEDWSIALER